MFIIGEFKLFKVFKCNMFGKNIFVCHHGHRTLPQARSPIRHNSRIYHIFLLSRRSRKVPRYSVVSLYLPTAMQRPYVRRYLAPNNMHEAYHGGNTNLNNNLFKILIYIHPFNTIK